MTSEPASIDRKGKRRRKKKKKGKRSAIFYSKIGYLHG